MKNKIDYQLITKLAFQVACKYIYDKDAAQDIAQLTAIECYLNLEKSDPENLNAWVYTVAKNKSYKYINDNKKSTDLIDKAFLKFKNEEEVTLYKNTEDFDILIENTPNKIVPIKQKEIIREVLQSNYDFKKTAAKFEMSYQTLRKKVYRIHQEILLYQKIEMGHVRTRPIPGTKLHENTLRFLLKLKSSLNNNDFSIFKEYEIDESQQNKLKSMKIKNVVSYQIVFKEQNLYKLFVPYFDFDNNFNCFWINLKINGSKISVASIPETPSLIKQVQRSDLPHPLQKTFRDGPDGLPSISVQELDKKLAECGDKVKVIFEDKNQLHKKN